ncbi:MAG: 16S rRNA (cytidine(1402)-2'-O)-methyltransferase [Patescibacteria group bacterium]
MGTLYIVATPIGNLQDLSLRAIDILTRVKIIACEDTRHTGLLLKYIRENKLSTQNVVEPTLLSYYEQNEFKRIPQVLNALSNGLDVALVSDAGTPTISDPGFKLVRECIKNGIRVESIPGPSSLISALVVSGLPTDKFLFLGYPLNKEGRRKKLFRSLTIIQRSIKVTYILFEAPHKLLKTLQELQEAFGNIDIVLARELTKIHEEIRREKISESIEHFSKVLPKGEFVVLFHLES